jgi:CubicO group peptidase (beta-lactamase class C family)
MRSPPPFIEKHVADGRLVGAVTLVLGRSDEPALACAGVRDLSSQAPMTADTIFRLHSMSKPLTALGALLLCDAGRCSLDTPAYEFVPELRNLRAAGAALPDAAPVTLRHLLTHTAGLPYPNAKGNSAERSLARAIGDMMSETRGLSLAEWTRRVGEAELAHAPGDGFTYGIAIDVLGGLIEAISGRPLDRFLAEHVFEPLGMLDTTFRLDAAQRPRLARVYRALGSGFTEIPDWADEPDFLSGGGRIYSTAQDYGRFCRMLLDQGVVGSQRLLRPETARAIASCQLGALRSRSELRQHPDLGAGASFGLLGRVVLDPAESGYGRAGTFGWDGVCGNTFFVDGSTGLAAVLLTQILPWPPTFHQDFRRWVYAEFGPRAAL